MNSTVKSRPNHYQVLGLSPAATDDQIKAAFARKMGMLGVHPLAAGAQICAAYEALRDPARRKAYDRSLGIAPEPQPSSWSIAAPRWNNAVGSAPAVRAGTAPIPAVQVDPQALASVEPRTGSAIAASLRDLAAPGVREPAPASRPQAVRRPEPEPSRSLSARGRALARRRGGRDRLAAAGARGGRRWCWRSGCSAPGPGGRPGMTLRPRRRNKR